MTNILALDTSTAACSVALSLDGALRHCLEHIPRQHDRRLFVQLERLLAGAVDLDAVELLAWTHGPGSFTGLRIAASAVQGLAFARGLPAVGVSTLACMAQGAWRRGQIDPSAVALVLLDARIDELYWGFYEWRAGRAAPLVEDAVGGPADLALPARVAGRALVPLGDGGKYIDRLDPAVRGALSAPLADCWPDAQDILPLAEATTARQAPDQVQPVYLRNEIGWKKMGEQGA